jgi:hypothetical protein
MLKGDIVNPQDGAESVSFRAEGKSMRERGERGAAFAIIAEKNKPEI